MLRAALGFFLLGLVAYLLGANNLSGMSMEVGRILLFVFIALAIISTVIGLITGKRVKIIS